MSKDKDFDELDSNNDGYLSEEEFKKGKKPSGIEKEKLNWFLRLLTLGDRFDIRDFWDRLKKSIVEFIILVFGVTVSFGIEQQGGESDNRADGIENLVNLREEIDKMIAYTVIINIPFLVLFSIHFSNPINLPILTLTLSKLIGLQKCIKNNIKNGILIMTVFLSSPWRTRMILMRIPFLHPWECTPTETHLILHG